MKWIIIAFKVIKFILSILDDLKSVKKVIAKIDKIEANYKKKNKDYIRRSRR